MKNSLISTERIIIRPTANIYLYGNMDMTEKLDFIDRHYLSAFDSLDVDSEIREQKAFDAMQDLTKEYPVAESESEEDNAYLSYNVVVGTAMDSLTAIAFESWLCTLSAPGAPLKKALLDAWESARIFMVLMRMESVSRILILSQRVRMQTKKKNLFPLSEMFFRKLQRQELTVRHWMPESTVWSSATGKPIFLPIRRV